MGKFAGRYELFSFCAAICCSLLLLLGVATVATAQNQDAGSSEGSSGGEGGSSSPGFEGIPDRESTYFEAVKQSAKKSRNSLQHIGSLINLGMYYNRAGRFSDASKILKQALTIVDSALKPTPPSARRPERTIERDHGDGTVSAEVVRVPMPYEETLQELLPQLISAELEANELTVVESHIKRLIALKGQNQVADKLSLMSAYSSYAQLMRRLHRPKEAESYQRKADEINSSFKPL